MKKLLLLLIIPFIANSQVFNIESDYINFSGNYLDNNFSSNTFLNTLTDVSITYEIILDSMPNGWDFQNCFPVCNPINTYDFGPISFPADSSVYLNGHFYPNGIIGEGLLVMELSAQHGLFLDTVTWRGTATEETNLKEYLNSSNEIKHITNLNGQILKNRSSEKIIIVHYKNGQSKTYFVIK